jgi:hypothetical protein
MADKAKYSIKIKGETKVFPLANNDATGDHNLIRWYDRKEISEIIGDLAGYKPEYVERRFVRPIKVGQTAKLGHDLGIGLGSIKLLVTREQ